MKRILRTMWVLAANTSDSRRSAQAPVIFHSENWALLCQANCYLVRRAVNFESAAEQVTNAHIPVMGHTKGETSVAGNEVAIAKERHSCESAIKVEP